jgi:hypothetical protein
MPENHYHVRAVAVATPRPRVADQSGLLAAAGGDDGQPSGKMNGL